MWALYKFVLSALSNRRLLSSTAERGLKCGTEPKQVILSKQSSLRKNKKPNIQSFSCKHLFEVGRQTCKIVTLFKLMSEPVSRQFNDWPFVKQITKTNHMPCSFVAFLGVTWTPFSHSPCRIWLQCEVLIAPGNYQSTQNACFPCHW